MNDLFATVLAQVEVKARGEAENEWAQAVDSFKRAVSVPDKTDPAGCDMPTPEGRELFVTRRVDEAVGRLAKALFELAFPASKPNSYQQLLDQLQYGGRLAQSWPPRYGFVPPPKYYPGQIRCEADKAS